MQKQIQDKIRSSGHFKGTRPNYSVKIDIFKTSLCDLNHYFMIFEIDKHLEISTN